MLTFPFFCPACQQMANAKADPLGLLFGKAGQARLQCENCESVFNAEVVTGGFIKVGKQIEQEDDD